MSPITKLFTVCALANILLGCASTGPVPFHARTPFIESEYLKYQEPGTSTVEGTVSFEPFKNPKSNYKTFDVIQKVFLVPATSYEDEAAIQAYKYNYNIEPADPRRAQYVRRSLASDAGKFEFKNVPAGDYYIVRVAEKSVDYKSDRGFQIGVERITVVAQQNLIGLDLHWAHNNQSGQNASVFCEGIDPAILTRRNPMTALCAHQLGK